MKNILFFVLWLVVWFGFLYLTFSFSNASFDAFNDWRHDTRGGMMFLYVIGVFCAASFLILTDKIKIE